MRIVGISRFRSSDVENRDTESHLFFTHHITHEVTWNRMHASETRLFKRVYFQV